MESKALTPRMLARPRLWWLAAGILAFSAGLSILIRDQSARVQSASLARAGWEIHDLRLLDVRVTSYDVVRGMALASDGTLWVATDYIPISFDGHEWEAHDQIDDWPFGDMRALIAYEDTPTAFDSDGQAWTGGRVCTEAPYPDQRCSCVVSPQPESGRETLRFDVPDASCGNVSALAFDQASVLWVGFWTDIRSESRFGLASYSRDQWTFYQTGDIADPLMSWAGASVKAVLIDGNGDLWIGLMGSPYVARVDPSSSSLSADPVPDGVMLARRISNTLSWTLAVLFGLASVAAAWSTYLTSRAGLGWAQRLREEPSPAAPVPRPAGRRLAAWILAPAIFLALWSVVNFLLIWKAALEVQFGPGVALGPLLALSSLAFLTGAGAGGLMSLRLRAVKGSRSPSSVVLATIALVLGIMVLIACFGLTWFAVGMLATG